MDLALIGAGRVGTAVGVLLARAGHRVVAASGRASTRERVRTYLPGVPVVPPADAATRAEVVVVGVPDDAIATVVREITVSGSIRAGQWVLHLSGATPLSALDAATAAGARRLSLHPLQTVPDVPRAIERIPGAAMAITTEDEAGWALGERLARDLGGEPFRLADEDRALYHAAAVFASNDLVAVTEVARRLLEAIGAPDPGAALAPLQRATLDNVDSMGPGAALTGPAVRGDAGTVERHLEALSGHDPSTLAAYVSLCRLQLRLASDAGRLGAEGRAAVEEVLSRWT